MEAIKTILKPLKAFLHKPFIRYSHHFKGLSLNPREEMLKVAMQFAHASRVSGPYMEFGVYKGDTFTAAFYLNKYHGPKDMNFYAFDSFEGLPEIQGTDAEFSQYQQGQYKNNVEDFEKSLKVRGVNMDKVKIIKGWFSESLESHEVREGVENKVAIAWIDCDLYKSAVDVLKFLTDKVSDGTIFIFDDWFSFRGDPKKGEQKAFREWLENNPHITVSEFHKFSWHGNSFILHVN